jgi:hypothetical protein
MANEFVTRFIFDKSISNELFEEIRQHNNGELVQDTEKQFDVFKLRAPASLIIPDETWDKIPDNLMWLEEMTSYQDYPIVHCSLRNKTDVIEEFKKTSGIEFKL